MNRAQRSRFTRARPRAPRSRSGTNKNGTPQETACGPPAPPQRSETSNDRVLAISSRAGGGGPNSGRRGAVSLANTGRPSSAWIETGTGPTPSSNTTFVTRPSRGIFPIDASTCAAPRVGCPANGSSTPGVKMRNRQAWPDASAGNTNTVSDMLNSRATRRICAGSSPRPSGKTASGFPPKGRSVKTSAV